MARIVVHTAKRPFVHKTPSGDSVHICMCGLSSNYPLCDGSHRMTTDEDDNTIYLYNSEKKRLVKFDLDQLRKV
ncbi:MAG: CDGSH iron-sulfur domain-containing protein [Aigarchaeota archaeon]|nr:CDGSH iron-sulfur domain-containing protein [Aigarchaeota archaeon]MCX8193542.1 CDGSH iron-sulfur domain-containing protein [Nitrososphaeria archaeon]MDW7986682.1 CDGSH iron-sulfur domain-containing protein [Nitrososphaerota archaeon]